MAALAANPGCRRRALLDGAGVDKRLLAQALGMASGFGQSQFAHQRGNSFEARAVADGGEALVRLLAGRLRDGSAPPEPGRVLTPDLSAPGPQGRTARTALALREATAAGQWSLLRHPMVSLEVAGSPVFLEPDAVVVHPDGDWSVVEIKSFPMLDGGADPDKVGAAARQAAVYALALEHVAARVPDGATARGAAAEGGGASALDPFSQRRLRREAAARDAGWDGLPDGPGPYEPGLHEPGPYEPGLHEPGPYEPGLHEPGPRGSGSRPHDDGSGPDDDVPDAPRGRGSPEGGPAGLPGDAAGIGGTGDPAGPSGRGTGPRVRHEVLLVCPKDFSNLPTGELVDVRRQLAVTRRQLARLTRIEEIAGALPEGTTFDLRLADDGSTPTRPVAELTAAVDAVDAAYAPECLSTCELAFHCRARARAAGAVEALGRSVRAELGGLTTVEAVLAAALDPPESTGAEPHTSGAGQGAPQPGASASDAPAGAGPTGATSRHPDSGATADEPDAPPDPAVETLRRAAALRAEALAVAGWHGRGRPGDPAGRERHDQDQHGRQAQDWQAQDQRDRDRHDRDRQGHGPAVRPGGRP